MHKKPSNPTRKNNPHSSDGINISLEAIRPESPQKINGNCSSTEGCKEHSEADEESVGGSSPSLEVEEQINDDIELGEDIPLVPEPIYQGISKSPEQPFSPANNTFFFYFFP